MKFRRISELSRRSMLRKTALAGGLSAIFKMTGGSASAQQPPAGARPAAAATPKGSFSEARGTAGPERQLRPHQ